MMITDENEKLLNNTENYTEDCDSEEDTIEKIDRDAVVYIVYCRRRKRFDKWVKDKEERVIIDMFRACQRGMEGSNPSKSISYKVMIWRKMTTAVNKGRDVYYLPNWADEKSIPENHFKMKNVFPNKIKFKAIVFQKDLKLDPRLLNIDSVGFDEIIKVV